MFGRRDLSVIRGTLSPFPPPSCPPKPAFWRRRMRGGAREGGKPRVRCLWYPLPQPFPARGKGALPAVRPLQQEVADESRSGLVISNGTPFPFPPPSCPPKPAFWRRRMRGRAREGGKPRVRCVWYPLPQPFPARGKGALPAVPALQEIAAAPRSAKR